MDAHRGEREVRIVGGAAEVKEGVCLRTPEREAKPSV
jgi:hypothetical protein